MTARIGIDTGGTFTDVVRWSKAGVRVHKLPSTPTHPEQAVLAGIAAVRRTANEPVDVVHGTTLGLNAVLEGRLPRTVFVTNTGFVDLIEIGRQERTELYALEPDRPTPPVPRHLRVGVDCRRGAGGECVAALTPAAIRKTVAAVRARRPQAIAIGLLHAPAAPGDEQKLARALRAALPFVPITCSAELWPAFGEYERFSAAILNAAITPIMAAYIGKVAGGLGQGQLRLMRSSIGVVAAAEAMRFPARAMFSGPAGGVSAARALAAVQQCPRVAAFDMGGTSTDVCLVQADALHTDQGSIGGLPLPLPTVDVHTVGCGGGSLAYADRGGALRVGPQSSGADPGPACYGKGDEPTVTDAHVALGHLGPDTLLAGGFPIDPDRSVRAIERLGRKLGLRPLATARGVLAVATVAMARAVMRITGERGVDPATVPLIAYGGAGGLHAAALAARLRMPSTLVPLHAGAFSALGLCLAGESAESLEPVRGLWSPTLERQLRSRGSIVGRELAARTGRGSRVTCALDLRFAGQGATLRVPIGQGSLDDPFRRRHQQRFGFVPDTPIEIVALVVRTERPGHPYPAGTKGQVEGAHPQRRAPLGGAKVTVLRRDFLAPGSRLRGPCVLEEPTATTWLPRGWTAAVTPHALDLRRPRD